MEGIMAKQGRRSQWLEGEVAEQVLDAVAEQGDAQRRRDLFDLGVDERRNILKGAEDIRLVDGLTACQTPRRWG